MMEIRRNGFTLVELLVVIGIVGVIAAIAVPALLRARISGNEAAAVGSLRAITSGQSSYATGCGRGGFATSLTILATPCAGGTNGFISPDLNPAMPGVTAIGSGVLKSGYSLQLTGSGDVGPVDLNGATTHFDYLATAVPVQVNFSGNRGFNVSASGAILVDPAGGPAGTTPLQ